MSHELVAALGMAMLASIVLWWALLWRASLRTPSAPRLVKYPSITVIRPVKGRDVGALDNFRAALNNGYPGHVETLFVFDDEQDPGLPPARQAIAEYLQSGRPGRADIVIAGAPPAGRTGKVHAMIAGLREAKGELVAFGDSDTRPDQQVLTRLVEALMANPQAGSAFAAAAVNRPPQAAGDVVYALLHNALYAPFAALASEPDGTLPFIMGQLMVLRRQALDAVGGPGCADGQLTDDMFIGRRLHEAGYQNLLVQQPLHIETGGLTLRQFVPYYRRWLQFSRSGLPGTFIWPQVLLGVQFHFALLCMIVGLLSGALWLVLLFGANILAITALLLDLNHRYGGAPIPPRLAWAAVALFVIAPAITWSIARNPQTEWRGRVYDMATRSPRPV